MISRRRVLLIGASFFFFTEASALAVTITTPSPFPSAEIGVAYSQTVTATGGTSPYAWTLLAGALPAGLALSGDGTISGMPSSAGVFGFTLKVQDTAGAVDDKIFQLTVTSPVPSSPVIASITPSSGDAAGGTSITIVGTDFQSGAVVKIGGVDAASAFVDSQKLIAVTPSEAAGPVDVQVINPDGRSSTSAGGFTFTSSPAGQGGIGGAIKAYPNPYTGGGTITFVVASDSDVTIFDSAGRLVKELHGNGAVPWNVTNDEGNRVRSGAYLVLIKGADGSRVKFLEIIQ